MTQITDATTLRDLSELLAQISSATGLTQKQLETQFEDVHVTVYRFNDRNLVPPADFDGIIDTWANSIKSQIRTPSKISPTPKKTVAKTKTTRKKTKTAAATKTAATTKKAASSKRTATTKKAASTKRKVANSTPAAPKTTRRTRKTRSKSSLPLPDNYKSVVSHLYGPSLKRIMPEETAQQRSFLEAIALESSDGVVLLKELSEIIAEKYTGKMAPAAAYNGLKNKAQVLLDELSGKRKPRKAKTAKRGRKPVTRTRKQRK